MKLIPAFIRRRIVIEPKSIRWSGAVELSRAPWELSLELVNFGADSEYRRPWMLKIGLLPLSLFVGLPLPRRAIARARDGSERYGELDAWGVSFGLNRHDLMLHTRWGRRLGLWEYPLVNWRHIRTEVRRPDGSWVEAVESWEEERPGNKALAAWNGKPFKKPDGRERVSYPYRYELRSGDVQNVTAEVCAKRYVRRRKWFMWTRFAEWADYQLDITFSDEVGERSGSWKGGCIGCVWPLLPNETMESALSRMEAERKFA